MDTCSPSTGGSSMMPYSTNTIWLSKGHCMLGVLSLYIKYQIQSKGMWRFTMTFWHLGHVSISSLFFKIILKASLVFMLRRSSLQSHTQILCSRRLKANPIQKLQIYSVICFHNCKKTTKKHTHFHNWNKTHFWRLKPQLNRFCECGNGHGSY